MEEQQTQNQQNQENQEKQEEGSSMAALLPIDSFSYTWLLNFPSSIIDHHHHHSHHHSYDDSSSFIEMDPRLPPSRRFFINESFKFDNFVSFSEEQSNLLHADELFRDGYVLPYLLTDSKAETVRELIESEPLDEIKIQISKSKRRKSCVKLRRLVLKYLDFLTPLCSRLRRFRSSGLSLSSIDTTRRNRVYNSDETTSSPRVLSVHQDDDYWRRSCDSESSIYEAVLHCKKSFEK